MILKGSERGGAKQLAAHLLNDRDNDHIALIELRGFVADDLSHALCESYAISKATKCTQFLFSLSLNPPKDQIAREEDFIAAANPFHAGLIRLYQRYLYMCFGQHQAVAKLATGKERALACLPGGGRCRENPAPSGQ